METKPLGWKHPDELLKLHRLQQRKKQLAARLSQNNNKPVVSEADKTQLLEAKIAQKRKNPFAKSSEDAKKTKLDTQQEDSLLSFVRTPTTKDEVFAPSTPLRSPPAKLVLKPFDAKEFSKLLQQSSAGFVGNDDDVGVEEQKFTKHLPIDWSIKTRARFFCHSELPATILKTNQSASGLTSFVRCIDAQNGNSGLDISPATRLNQATYYWQHPYVPWLTLYPRNSKDNNGIILGQKERDALQLDWDYSFQGLFQLLRARQCPYFYLCANSFTVLFRAAGVGGRVEMHALMSPTTRGIRNAMRQEGIEFVMPLKKDALNKSGEGSAVGNEAHNELPAPSENTTTTGDSQSDAEEDEDDEWLQELGVDEKEIKRIQAANARNKLAKEMSDDFSDNSIVLIEGIECQGFFSFLLNAKSTISTSGRLAGVPPTLLAPVAFPKASIQHLNTRSNKVRMDGVDYHSIEVKGTILPTFLPYVCDMLGETRETFSVTMATNTGTLAFSKASQKILDEPHLFNDENEFENSEQVFGQENLSDCGLLPNVIKSICRTGLNGASILERVCYNSEHGYAWS